MKFFICTIISIFYLAGEFSNPVNSSETSEMVPPDTLIEMERTVCYGTCPSYEITIQKNGKLTFVGKEFVEHKGRAEGMISDENMEQLIETVEKSHFMEISPDPVCESRYTDMPTVFLTIKLDGEQNSVTHYHGCKGFKYEEELYRLEAVIDSLAGVKKWIGES